MDFCQRVGWFIYGKFYADRGFFGRVILSFLMSILIPIVIVISSIRMSFYMVILQEWNEKFDEDISRLSAVISVTITSLVISYGLSLILNPGFLYTFGLYLIFSILQGIMVY